MEGPRAHRACLESLAFRGHRASKEPGVWTAKRGNRAQKEMRGVPDRWDCPDPLAPRGILESPALMAGLVQ